MRAPMDLPALLPKGEIEDADSKMVANNNYAIIEERMQQQWGNLQ
jgi:hypothetical protein